LSAVNAPTTAVPPVTPVDAEVTTPVGFDEPSPVMAWTPNALPSARPACIAR
jgi:hypothetical protein